MAGMIRTDLALEARQLWQEREQTEDLPGVRVEERRREGFPVTTVEVLDRQGAEALGKPPGRYVTLGTDGFGRSDTRVRLRHFFEVDRYWIALAALRALADDGRIDRARVAEAIEKYGIDADKPNPLTV